MKEDIVPILRQKARGDYNRVGDRWGDWICDEAADEIEQLRAELEEANRNRWNGKT